MNNNIIIKVNKYEWSMEFCRRLKELLEDREMTQRELATRIGVTEVTVSRYVSGERIPKAPTVLEIARAVNCPVEVLIDFNKTETCP